MTFEIKRRDECLMCQVKKSYVEKLEKVVDAARFAVSNLDKKVEALNGIMDALYELDGEK